MFLILFSFTLVFFNEQETREGWIVQRVHLYIWDSGGHKLTVSGIYAQSFNH